VTPAVSQGDRTIFRIRVVSGVDISALSSIPGGQLPPTPSPALPAKREELNQRVFAEREILLLPCCCFDILKVGRACPSLRQQQAQRQRVM
jgi:hypothetical protein